MNATQLYSLLLQEKGLQGNYSIGRVQAPTLYLIYDRQMQIENFVSKDYYEIENDITVNQNQFKANLSPYEKFESQDVVNMFLKDKNTQEGKQEGIVESIDKEIKYKESPRLFSLNALQSKSNNLFKATAKQTLQTVSSLYEKKFLTYPRTNCNFITQNEFIYLKDTYTKYCDFLGIKQEMKKVESRKRYVDDSKVQEHYAIIPTRKTPSHEEFQAFNPLEKSIYLLVLKTTISMFLDSYEYEETSIYIKTSDLLFKAKGQVPCNAGWTIIFKETEETEEELITTIPHLSIGQSVESFIRTVKKKTSPPILFNEGTLIVAMKTCGKEITDNKLSVVLKEVEGIGTEATRADTIETLKKREYIEIKKNKIIVTEKGKILCQAIEGQPLLKSAEMTATWETYLKTIGKGQGEQEKFITNIKKFIIHLIEKVPKDIEKIDVLEYIKNKQVAENIKIVGKCPLCSNEIKEKKSFYGCAGYPNCKFTIPDNFRKKKLNKSNIKELLSNGETIVKNVKSSNKTSMYNAKVKLNDKNNLEFMEFVSEKKEKR